MVVRDARDLLGHHISFSGFEYALLIFDTSAKYLAAKYSMTGQCGEPEITSLDTKIFHNRYLCFLRAPLLYW